MNFIGILFLALFSIVVLVIAIPLLLMKSFANNFFRRHAEQTQRPQSNTDGAGRRNSSEGKVYLSKEGPHKEKVITDNVGDYVDFEEVNE